MIQQFGKEHIPVSYRTKHGKLAAFLFVCVVCFHCWICLFLLGFCLFCFVLFFHFRSDCGFGFHYLITEMRGGEKHENIVSRA